MREENGNWIFQPSRNAEAGGSDHGFWNGRSSQDGIESGTSAPPRHFEGYNYLFADGHVKFLRPSATVGPSGGLDFPRGMWTINDTD
jgi:prepilin-type processing-associated H-X9-DG protein